MSLNCKLECTWVEVVAAYLKVLSQYFPVETEESYK
jgi:hypothetical protein